MRQKDAARQIFMTMETMAKRITKQELKEDRMNPKQPEQVANMMISWHQEADIMDKQTSMWQEVDKLNLMLVVDTNMSCQIASQTKIPNMSLP